MNPTLEQALEAANGWQAGPTVKVLAAEIDRLRVELRRTRGQLMKLTLSIFHKPSDEVAWQAETNLLCGGPEKGATG